MFEYQFMQNALIAVFLVMPLFGLLSTMIVSNRMAFFSDSLGHGAFAGIAIGVLLGSDSPLTSLITFSIIFALLITFIKNKTRTGADTVIGVFSSTAIALGLMIMSAGGSFNKFSTYLIGDLLSIGRSDLISLAILFVCVFVLWIFLFNQLLILSINQSFARSRGISTLLIESTFAIAVAVTVAVSIQWTGILIINAMLVLPAAAARNISSDIKHYHLVSVLIAVISGVSGLVIAYHLNTAAGATIILISAIVYFFTLFFKHK